VRKAPELVEALDLDQAGESIDPQAPGELARIAAELLPPRR